MALAHKYMSADLLDRVVAPGMRLQTHGDHTLQSFSP